MQNYAIPKRGVVGYEVVERYDQPGLGAQLVLWSGDWKRGRILDRRYGTPAQRRCLATIRERDGRFDYTMHAGARGGWRHGSAPTYEAALQILDRWVQRRFTPKGHDHDAR